MKTVFRAMWYTIRKWCKDNSRYLKIMGIVTWFMFSGCMGYILTVMYQSHDMPNEGKYLAYESIVRQIADDGIRNVRLPNNTIVEVSENRITISNSIGYYSVTGSLTETEILFEINDGSSTRMLNQTWYLIALGLLAIGVAGGCIIYFSFKLVKHIIIGIIGEYREQKKELEKDNEDDNATKDG